MANYLDDNTYSLLIFVLPLLGLLASNIYTNLDSKTWYSNLNIVLPDLFTGNYGLYITAFVFLFAGISFSNIHKSLTDALTNSFNDPTKITETSWWKSDGLFDSIILWFIPITFLLIYIANPIMYQTKNVLAAAIIYIFILILLILFIIYCIKLSLGVFMFLIPLLIWAFYMTLFLFTITDPSKTKTTIFGKPIENPSTYNAEQIQQNTNYNYNPSNNEHNNNQHNSNTPTSYNNSSMSHNNTRQSQASPFMTNSNTRHSNDKNTKTVKFMDNKTNNSSDNKSNTPNIQIKSGKPINMSGNNIKK
jgi:tryptophan-rich sensory protein